MRFINPALVAVILSVAALPAYAQGILFVQKDSRGSQSTTNQVQIDKNYMRAESQQGADQAAFVFDGPKQIVRTINISKKTYIEITKAELDQMRQQVNSAMAQMEQQLRGLPPEQRQAVEQMMRGRGMPGMAVAQAPKVEYRQTGSDKVGQWACTKYEGYVGQQKTAEVCTVDPRVFGVTAADFDVARQLAEFIKSMVPESLERMVINGTVAEQGFAGIPVRRTAFRNGAVDSVSEITEFRRETFPASTFEVPAGFRKEAMPGPRGGR